MPAPDSTPETPQPSRFSATLARVLIVQVVALTLLGFIQVFYNR